MRIASWGHAVFAATMISLGILGLIKGDFTPIWLPVPKGVPAREVLVYLSAIVPLAAGIGLLWQRAAPVASRVLFGFLLAWLLVLDVPHLFLRPGMQLTWAVCKTAVTVAAAWVLYVWFAGDRDGQRLSFATGDTGLRIARALYGLALIPRHSSFHVYREDHLDGAWLAAMALGLGVLLWLYLHRGGLRGAHQRVCTAGSHALGVTAGHVHGAGVGTHPGSRTQRLGLERVRRLLGVDGSRLGGGGFLPRRVLACRGQA